MEDLHIDYKEGSLSEMEEDDIDGPDGNDDDEPFVLMNIMNDHFASCEDDEKNMKIMNEFNVSLSQQDDVDGKKLLFRGKGLDWQHCRNITDSGGREHVLNMSRARQIVNEGVAGIHRYVYSSNGCYIARCKMHHNCPHLMF